MQPANRAPKKNTRNTAVQHKQRPVRSYRLGFPIALLVLIVILLAVQSSSGGWSDVLSYLRPEPENEASVTTGTSALNPSSTPGQSQTMNTTSLPEAPQQVILTAVGDIVMHQAVIDGGQIGGEDPPAYDFNPAFQYIKPVISASDLAFVNYEGTLFGPPYSGFPFFAAPDAIADALFDAGFRVAWTANNHALDKGIAGLIRTYEVFRDKGFHVVGTRPDQNSRSDKIVTVHGIKIGLLAYTFETIGTETRRSLNGIPMPDGAEHLLDSFNPDRSNLLRQDLDGLIAHADRLRKEGAEMICLSLHWGVEYQTKSTSYQRQIAQQLADAGIELIIGHHPHVLQEIDVLSASDGSSKTLVFYSIGNLLHNMTFSTHNSAGFAQDAMIVRVNIERREGTVAVTGAEYIPTYVTRKAEGKGYQHLIVPVIPAMADPAAYQSDSKLVKASYERTSSVLAGSNGTADLPVVEAAR